MVISQTIASSGSPTGRQSTTEFNMGFALFFNSYQREMLGGRKGGKHSCVRETAIRCLPYVAFHTCAQDDAQPTELPWLGNLVWVLK